MSSRAKKGAITFFSPAAVDPQRFRLRLLTLTAAAAASGNTTRMPEEAFVITAAPRRSPTTAPITASGIDLDQTEASMSQVVAVAAMSMTAASS